MNTATLLQENTSLKEALASLQAEFQTSLQTLQQENKLLRQKLALFIQRYFGGQKNESLDPAQLELLLAGLPAAVSAPVPVSLPVKPAGGGERKKAVRQPLPAHLETERVILEPAEVQAAPAAWKQIGEEVTEELDWKPAKFIKRLYIRPKYVRQPLPNAAAHLVDEAVAEVYGESASPVVIAPLPSRLIEKGLPGAGLLAQVIISKYEDHLPLYRQEKIFRERHGVALRRQSLVDWVEQVARWLQPIYEVMKRGLLRGGYLQVDETPIRYLDPDLPGKSQQGYLWTYSRPGAEVVFDWRTSRGREGPEVFLQDYQGRLQADGYAVYRSWAKGRNGVTLFGCWAHARRKFHEGREADRRAAWFLRQIGHLYGIEQELREQHAGPALRQAVRQAQARPVLVRIEKAMNRLAATVLPQSQLGEAIRYAQDQWVELCRYVDDGRVEVDNNLVENAIRPTAIGKKNFLFIGHPQAGWRSAVIYSVLGSCRRLGLNPHEYLEDVLRRLPDLKITEIESVTPVGWAKAKKEAAKQRQS